MKFKIGDIVKRCNDGVFPMTNQFYGKVVGFEGGGKDAWVQIEGEYYFDSLNHQCINHYNPRYLEKVKEPGFVLIKSIKKFDFM